MLKKKLQRRMDRAEQLRLEAFSVARLTDDWATLRVLSRRYCRAAKLADLTAQKIVDGGDHPRGGLRCES